LEQVVHFQRAARSRPLCYGASASASFGACAGTHVCARQASVQTRCSAGQGWACITRNVERQQALQSKRQRRTRRNAWPSRAASPLALLALRHRSLPLLSSSQRLASMACTACACGTLLADTCCKPALESWCGRKRSLCCTHPKRARRRFYCVGGPRDRPPEKSACKRTHSGLACWEESITQLLLLCIG
jgi:hypothetical protein